MEPKEAAEYARGALLKAGADKVQVSVSRRSEDELNVENHKINLCRTTFNDEIRYRVIKDRKMGIFVSNKLTREAVDRDIKQVLELAEAAVADEARDIAEYRPPKSFSSGPEGPDKDVMYVRQTEFLDVVRERFPGTIIEGGGFVFRKTLDYHLNSNGTEYETRSTFYNFLAIFTSKRGDRSSSMNFSSCALSNPDKELIKTAQTELLLKQSSEQIDLKPLQGKFTGDIIVTPGGMEDFYRFFIEPLYDNFLIGGDSIYKDNLGLPVADARITIHCRPVGDEMAVKDFIGPDGYELQNSTLIDKGVLKSFLLTQYGANKTGFPRAVNQGTHPVIEAGSSSFDDIVKSVKRGLLLGRFSGGNPSYSGDFSGVAKNSYYIEEGRVLYPVGEVMISGNLHEMFNNLNDISAERISSGCSVFPYMSFSGILISGK